MSTNATITVKVSDDKYLSIYCHWDGYPAHVGKLLIDNYNTLDKATELVKLGSISSLAASIDCPDGHSFETPAKGCTVFYGRDRGETTAGPVTGCSLYHVHINGSRLQQYNYVFENGQWLVNTHNLTEILADVV